MEFKQSVIEALQYYVYCLVDPRDQKIFYIGKGGVGNRVFNHAADSLKEEIESLKLDTIREILLDLHHRLREKIYRWCELLCPRDFYI